MEISYCPSRQKYRVEGGNVKYEKDEDGYDDDDDQEEEEEEDNGIISGEMDITDSDYRYYMEYFHNQPHYNLLASDDQLGVIIISAVKRNDGFFVVMLRTKKETKRIKFGENLVRTSWLRRLFGLGPSVRNIIRAIDETLPVNKFKSTNNVEAVASILTFDQRQIIKGLKFGVLYRAKGQVEEEEMFSNVKGSREFEEFLELLGDKVPLLNWEKFRAGLDVKTETTGEHSIYTEYQNNQIMFHVSTLLPYSSDDLQQLERKRHIGNDIVIIVFQDEDDVFRPQSITSRQIQVIILIKPESVKGKPGYRVSVISKAGVPRFAPELPDEPVFKRNKEFKEFLYKKLINAEKACYCAPVIAGKLEYSRNALLADIYETYT